jgi:hypothetical protein
MLQDDNHFIDSGLEVHLLGDCHDLEAPDIALSDR